MRTLRRQISPAVLTGGCSDPRLFLEFQSSIYQDGGVASGLDYFHKGAQRIDEYLLMALADREPMLLPMLRAKCFLENLLHVNEADDQNIIIRYLLSVAYLRVGRYPESMRNLAHFLEHNPPIHPIRAKDNELVKDWYISSTSYFNSCDPPLAKSEKVYPGPSVKHDVGDNGNDRVHAGISVVSIEYRVLTLEFITMEIYLDVQILKKRVSAIEQKVEDNIEKEDEGVDDWNKLDELLQEAQLHNLEESRASLDELVGKVDRVESRV